MSDAAAVDGPPSLVFTRIDRADAGGAGTGAATGAATVAATGAGSDASNGERDAGTGPDVAQVAQVATIRLERPSEHNRIDPDDIPVIAAHLDAVASNPRCIAVVVTGMGDATFSSGYTLQAIIGRLDHSFEKLLDAVEQCPVPTICALNGSVYGGATDLALCCDFRIGVRGSRMFMPAARFGLHYYPGGLRRFVNAIGASETKRLFLTAQTIDAETMLRIGYLNDLVAREALASRVGEYVTAIARCEPAVVRSMKRQIDAIASGTPAAASVRDDYDRSLKSDELKRRVRELTERKSTAQQKGRSA